ncbi:MAG: glycoside hydrolase family 57 protein [Dysgonamonadaceae bacterium]|nr:glycoside hydrolase family 57 protein [Dysgonamonadaceae bacterium]MDD3356013.1 glycoside hydrolase family 57 protein [Dysgonamonadaceae bacterium]MDD3727200.1 glycoside hydrolase family 57 protein [Dysgonamonadaceae bacterium]MDD4246258.1 glycoside hydrolase family 57 protein [Dysgonamonadaceae bacterium]MDD4605136.1 glycoside hydrolase family 57 protein [Dysgonamonadaceae bacterium]
MKTICFYFQIHQPFRLKRYRFFNIGRDHYYYDDFSNEDIMQRIAANSFIPANRMLFDLVNQYKGRFKIAFSISGIALEQLEIYAPEVIDGLRQLANTGNVEFLAETYAHSLASTIDPIEFKNQVKQHADKIEMLFDQKPTTFRNTELIYSNDIGKAVYEMGYTKMITEGAKHVLGWKSPNYVYTSSVKPKLKLLLKNHRFSDDIMFRFSNYSWNEYPLTADKFINWIDSLPEKEQIVNLFMNYETFGSMQPSHTGIFEFMKALPHFAFEKGMSFSTPSEVMDTFKPIGSIDVIYPISWADEERDLSAWLGNTLQKEAFRTLYEIGERVRMCNDRRLKQDWLYLQTSDHFYYMSTKHFSDGAVHDQFSPYPSPYDAFNNYMNVLSDFIERVRAQYPDSVENEELNALLLTINNQALEIKKLQSELKTVIDRNVEKLVESPAKSKEKEKEEATDKKSEKGKNQ